ncbi:MAG: ATP-binding protein [Planctomycetaceae bacterium]|jgi:AAA+ superfamily predicted ATPase|nr:ATP-binding protein [Planctomycetaceae bacterium]
MRSTLVIKLVEAANEGTAAFQEAVKILAEDEKKKGNNDVSEKLRLALLKKKEFSPLSYSNTTSNNLFSLSRIKSPSSSAIPQNKSTSFSLFEIIEPTIGFENLFYSPEVTNIFKQIIAEWNKSEQLLKAGIPPTQRILLHGPPGCGKTMAGFALAKAIKMPVAYIRLDSLFSSFLGQTSSNLRSIFDSVAASSRILFLDEFDAVAKKRDDNHEIGEIKRIVISLLQNLDFLPPEVIVIAATNHEHLLDPAVWRRFDMSINIGLPDYKTRKRMIDVWLNPYQPKVKNTDTDTLAKITEHFNIAGIKKVILQTIKKVLFLDELSEVTTNDFIRQLILLEGYTVSNESLLKFAQKLRSVKLPLTSIEHITGIPKSTIGNHTRCYKKVKNEK